MPESISCPECGAEIPLTEAISQQVEGQLRSEFEAAAHAREAEHELALAEKDAALLAGVAEARVEIEATAATQAKDAGGCPRSRRTLNGGRPDEPSRPAEQERRYADEVVGRR